MQNKWYSGTDSEKMVMLLIERKIHEALWDIYKIIFHPFPPGDFSRCQPVGFTGFLFYTNRRWRGVIFIRGKVGDVFPGERVRGLEARRVWQGFCVTMCVIGGWWVDEVMPGNGFKLVFGDACFKIVLVFFKDNVTKLKMFQLETNNFGDAWCGGITWFFLVLISAKLTIDSRTSLNRRVSQLRHVVSSFGTRYPPWN